MLDAVEVGQLDHAAGLALGALPLVDRQERSFQRSADLRRVLCLLQEERHAGRAALVAKRSQPRDVARTRAGARLAATDYPVERLRPRAIRQTCWYVIP